MLFAHMGMEHSSPKIMMSFNLSFLEIILRLSMATIFAAIIGLDRKEHNHPAGLRTHILVCLGACILALIQEAICNQVLYYAKNFHTLSTVLESDPARLIAQVIGGIGFIGAGTIVITHHFVMYSSLFVGYCKYRLSNWNGVLLYCNRRWSVCFAGGSHFT
ncbi:Protein SapB [Lactobacillus helveticus]|uniref:MgtC/SapB family protein n=1 Tax=Lactobacillus helveticus TaxID=1587 RepID=UPI0019F43EE5|nr:MgtC/SapB family protein [Lactobacillus helveticus]NRO40825.1 Protein SapB [Lactobacillus helveticus]